MNAAPADHANRPVASADRARKVALRAQTRCTVIAFIEG